MYAVCAMPDDTAMLGPQLPLALDHAVPGDMALPAKVQLPVLDHAQRAMRVSQGRQTRRW